MGCNCGGVRNTMRGGRPISGPRQRGTLTGATPTQLRALALQSNTGVSALSVSGMNKKRRDVEKKRRAAVQKALGRP